MNAYQMRILLAATALTVVMIIFPPFHLTGGDLFKTVEYAFFPNAPIRMNIDGSLYYAYRSVVGWDFLMVQFLMIWLSVGVLYSFYKKR